MKFRDDYTDFSYNDIDSSLMKVWITNSNDLVFKATPEFSDTYVSPTFANQRYYSGTTLSKQTFSLKCIAIEITMMEWKAIQRWLSPYSSGKLVFGYNKWGYFNVKLDQLVEGTIYVVGNARAAGDYYNIEFTLTFSTIDDWACLGKMGYYDVASSEKIQDSSINNKYLMPSCIKIDSKQECKKLLNTINVCGKTIYGKGTIDDEETINNKLILLDGTKEYGKIILNNNKLTLFFKNDSGNYIEEISNAEKITFYQNLLLVIKSNSTDNNNYLYEKVDCDEYAIMNCGSYNTYLNITTDTIRDNNYKLKVLLNNEEKFDYTSNKAENVFFTINGKTGLVLCNNNIAESIYYINGSIRTDLMLSDNLNRGPLIVESGNPEFKEVLVLKVEANSNGTTEIIFISSPFIYPRTNSCFNFFDNYTFNTVPYNNNFYPELDSNGFNYNCEVDTYTVIDPILSTVVLPTNNSPATYKLTFPTDSKLGRLNDIQENRYYNLSVCDYSKLSMIGGNEGQICFQTRDVL